MADVQNEKVETLEEKWQWSHWTYVGNVFDTPEHQEALSKLKTIEEKIAYKEAFLEEQTRKIIEEAEAS